MLKLSNIKSKGVNKVVFGISDRTKTGRKFVVLNKYTECENLDPVSCLNAYLTATQAWRSSVESHDGLFLALNEPHQPVKPCTIARWLTDVMDAAGIDTDTYRAHSVRSASTSKAKQNALSCAQIIKAASWANAQTFKIFFHKEIESEDKTVDSVFSQAVLKL